MGIFSLLFNCAVKKIQLHKTYAFKNELTSCLNHLKHFSRWQKRATFVVIGALTLYLVETPFNTSVNRSDPDHATLVRAALQELPDQGLLCLIMEI